MADFSSGWTTRTAPKAELWEQPCYIFQERAGFGIEAASVREAYDQLSIEDSWLILLRDSSAGIHRPETRWDDEKFIKT